MTSPASGAAGRPALPDYAPVPRSSLGPALNGVLAAADIEILIWTTAFAILQSIRLDQGPSSPVHP